jgi:hypothetical protein
MGVMIFLTLFVDFFLYNFLVMMSAMLWHPVVGIHDPDESKWDMYLAFWGGVIVTAGFNVLMINNIINNF